MIPPYVGLLVDALWTTLTLGAISALGAAIWGAIIFSGSNSRSPLLKKIAGGYVQIFRNIPVLLPVYLVYFGFPMLGIYWSAAICGCLALILQQGAYVSEILRGGAKSIDKNMYEAARTIGLSRWKTFRLITIPLVVANSLPALGNQTVLLVKDTSLFSAISVLDLMAQSKLLVESAGTVYMPFIVAGVLYLIVASMIDIAFRLIARTVRWR
ncbi:amino acid ABC transporter permease [Pseudomonas azerbaijanoccidentalis]|jgi:polar amino acid transport system permease protein